MLPFFIVAALVVAIGAGTVSGGRTAADFPSPAVKGSGFSKRWYIWYIAHRNGVVPCGPYYVSEDDAAEIERGGRALPGVLRIYRWVYDSARHHWVPDTARATPNVGAIPVTPPITGPWTFAGFPPVVSVGGKFFKRAVWQYPRSNVVAQYREAIPQNSAHLFVLKDGTWVVDHIDEANPDAGRVLEHAVKDVILRRAGRSY